jgi:cellobiose phosphorylase
MYRLIVESLLGLSLEVDRLRIAPCLHPQWKEFTVHYRFRDTVYHISVSRHHEKKNGTLLILDGAEQTGQTISLVDDHLEHWIKVRMDAKYVE